MTNWFTGMDALPRARPRYRVLSAVDISNYSDRDQFDQIQLREAMYKIVDSARKGAQLSRLRCRSEDRGDGILMVAAPRVGLEVLLTRFVSQVGTGVSRHNRRAAGTLGMRLRMALHAGYVHRDRRGFSGDAVNHLARLVDAPALKVRMGELSLDFGVIVSEHIYREAVGYHLIDPRAAASIPVEVKGTHSRAWMLLP